MDKAAFGMLVAPPLARKPRTTGMMLMSEVGIPLRQTEDLLEIAAPIIDYAKITDHLGLLERLSAAWIRRKVALYNSYNVKVVPGGIPFQVAVVQRKVPQFFKAVRDLGFAGVEMSEDVIEPLAPAQRAEWIAMARELGLSVMTEVGRKNVDVKFDVASVARQVRADVELGVSKIYIESAEIQHLVKGNPRALDRLYKADGKALLFELGLNSPQEKAVWLVERYGPSINFASVSPYDVVAVDAIRRGMHRKEGFSYIFGKRAGGGHGKKK
jgi:phosphosulfolactate synthase